jgi:site-specific DNA-cytosine methylase
MVRFGGNIWEGIVPTLRAESHRGDAEPHILIIDGTRVDDVRVTTEPVYTLEARMGTGGNNVPIIAFDGYNQTVTEDIYRALRIGIDSGDCIAIPIQDGREMEKKQNGLGIGSEGDPSYTLDQTGAQAVAIQGTIIGRADHNGPQGSGVGQPGAPMYTLDSVSQHGVEHNMQVRRLTPVECERLMGWPDNHTLPRTDGKQNPDTTRYKMCGNGVASPVAQWIGQNLMEIMGGQ